MQPLRSPFAKDAPPRAPRVVPGLTPLPHRDRIVPGGNLVYVEGYKTNFRPKPAAEQATLLEGFERLRGDPKHKAAALYLLSLDADKAVAVWNDLGIDFILDDFQTRMVIGVYGIAALPGALGRLAKSPKDVLDGLSRADVVAVAPVVAHARLSTKKDSGQDDADFWLITWARTAAIALIPIAVGPLGAARDEAESALRFLDKRRHGPTLRDVAAKYGADAVAALDEVLSAFELPKKPPKVPEWAAPSRLPPLLDHEGAALDEASAQTLLELLIAFAPELIQYFVPFDEPQEGEVTFGRNVAQHVARFHPEVLRAKAMLGEGSRDAFVAALYAAWMEQGGSAKDKWALFASSALGSDEAAARLHAGVLSSHKDKKHARARLIVDALAIHGSARSVAALSAIAGKKALKETAAAAEARLGEAATQRGTNADDLADLATPLAAPGSAEAKRAFVDAAARFERRMVERRRMSAAHFRSAILGHSVLIEIARTIVFGVYAAPGGRPTKTFHVEGTRAVDRLGAPVLLLDGDMIGVVHPLDLDANERTAWREAFDELELLPPFPALGRPVFEVEPSEREATAIERFAGNVVTTGALLGIARLGWSASVDDRTVTGYSRTLGGVRASFDVTPGYHVGRPDPKEQQTVGAASAHIDDGAFARAPARLGKVDPVVFSELVLELSTVLGPR